MMIRFNKIDLYHLVCFVRGCPTLETVMRSFSQLKNKQHDIMCVSLTGYINKTFGSNIAP